MKKILWTGGWDSTFRLLQLVLIEKTNVQPIYINDADRKSNAKELEAINNIRIKIAEKYPEAITRISDLQIFDKVKITIDDYLQECFIEICKTKRLGDQYLWIASFCKQNKIDNIELCIENDSKYYTISSFLQSFYKEKSPKSDSRLTKVVNDFFEYFSFNLFDVTKMDILNISKKNDWIDIMNLTWFCHKPLNNKPCGTCNPCLDVLKEGLGFRIPKNRILYTKIKLLKKKFKKVKD